MSPDTERAGRARYRAAAAELGDQLLGPRHHAGEAVADADGNLFGALLAVGYHIEMRVERGDLINLRLGDMKKLRQPMQMGGG